MSVASAGTIIERPGDDTTGGGPVISLDQMLAVTWTQNFTLTNWAVQAYNLQNEDENQLDLRFELRANSPTGALLHGFGVGIAGTTLEPVRQVLSFDDPGNITLSLSPGTYYVLASVADDSPSFMGSWWNSDLPVEAFVTAPNTASIGLEQVSIGGMFEPGEGLNVGFAVSGAVEAVPEPATLVLVGAGLLLAGGIARRRRA